MSHKQTRTAEVSKILHTRRNLVGRIDPSDYARKVTAEGGCGVIGIASSVPIEGRHLLRSLVQMRNRANGKGGGAAIAGLDAQALGVSPAVLREDYLLAIAYLDETARDEVEDRFITPMFDLHHTHNFPMHLELDPPAPAVVSYFVQPRAEALEAFAQSNDLADLAHEELEDEFVYQNSYSLNSAHYAALGDTRAFVLSHGKDLLVLKLVGFGDDVFRAYGLESLKAHVWIGHHRYPTKGRVWHPGGAHPFVGLNEALVHNGDFANYASVCSYLAQHNIRPLFLTDTEVSVLVFDLHHRTFGYPLEYVIETLAPTTERDFALLPPAKREIYARLQASHIHGSPDGPWFFLVAQSVAGGTGLREVRLLGITDTSMLRPQVFALQQGEPGQPTIGFAASEKQAIDAAMLSLSESDPRFWTRPDLVWNARGGSHTDGGAFLFSVSRDTEGQAELSCRDKFGRQIEIDETASPFRGAVEISNDSHAEVFVSHSTETAFKEMLASITDWTYEDLQRALGSVLFGDLSRANQLKLFSLMLNLRYSTGHLRRSSLLSLVDEALAGWVQSIRDKPGQDFAYHDHQRTLPDSLPPGQAVVLNSDGFAAQGTGSLALEIRALTDRGFKHIVVVNARGHRFIANGLGEGTKGVKLEVFGSSGDYLASGIDGLEIIVHGSGQDQLGQIMKSGTLVVFGDVGQTFMYGAKGGEAFVMGNAAGRPLINAVGKPRVVINGTCLDYLAESFMAGDPLNNGGFVVLNGVGFDGGGRLYDLKTPYPGGNLFSLASGGAIFVRDPERTIGEDQLNGGEFAPVQPEHWALIQPYLEANGRLFGIPVERLLTRAGEPAEPHEVYRLIQPSVHEALQPEQAWVRHQLELRS